MTIAGRVSANLTQSAMGDPQTVVVEDATNRLILLSTTPVNTALKQFMVVTLAFPWDASTSPNDNRMCPSPLFRGIDNLGIST